jgi:RimJ/RimL family protein N-acetyltransferase
MDVPARIDTERLVLRCWKETDAPLLREAIDNSLDHLRRWMPWAMEEPKSMEETRERLREYAAMFEAGEEFIYGVFNRDQSEVIGGSGCTVASEWVAWKWDTGSEQAIHDWGTPRRLLGP